MSARVLGRDNAPTDALSHLRVTFPIDGPRYRKQLIEAKLLVPAEKVKHVTFGDPENPYWHEHPPTLRLLGWEKVEERRRQRQEDERAEEHYIKGRVFI